MPKRPNTGSRAPAGCDPGTHELSPSRGQATVGVSWPALGRALLDGCLTVGQRIGHVETAVVGLSNRVDLLEERSKLVSGAPPTIGGVAPVPRA